MYNNNPLQRCSEILGRHKIAFSADAIKGKSRDSGIVFIRALVVFILRRQGYSLEEVGGILGGRDHSTIMHLERYNKADSIKTQMVKKNLIERYNRIVASLGTLKENSLQEKTKRIYA